MPTLDQKLSGSGGPLLVRFLLVRISNYHGFLKLKNSTKFLISTVFIFKIYIFVFFNILEKISEIFQKKILILYQIFFFAL